MYHSCILDKDKKDEEKLGLVEQELDALQNFINFKLFDAYDATEEGLEFGFTQHLHCDCTDTVPQSVYWQVSKETPTNMLFAPKNVGKCTMIRYFTLDEELTEEMLEILSCTLPGNIPQTMKPALFQPEETEYVAFHTLPGYVTQDTRFCGIFRVENMYTSLQKTERTAPVYAIVVYSDNPVATKEYRDIVYKMTKERINVSELFTGKGPFVNLKLQSKHMLRRFADSIVDCINSQLEHSGRNIINCDIYGTEYSKPVEDFFYDCDVYVSSVVSFSYMCNNVDTLNTTRKHLFTCRPSRMFVYFAKKASRANWVVDTVKNISTRVPLLQPINVTLATDEATRESENAIDSFNMYDSKRYIETSIETNFKISHVDKFALNALVLHTYNVIDRRLFPKSDIISSSQSSTTPVSVPSNSFPSTSSSVSSSSSSFRAQTISEVSTSGTSSSLQPTILSPKPVRLKPFSSGDETKKILTEPSFF